MRVVCPVFDTSKNTGKSVNPLKEEYNSSMCVLRFTFEYFILHVLSYVVSEQLNIRILPIDNELCL